MDIQGKKILLYVSKFHGYEKKIKEALEKKGATVDYIDNKVHRLDPHATNGRFKVIRKFIYNYFNLIDFYVEKNVVPLIISKAYDVFFCINCYSVNQSLLNILRKNNSNLYSILYLWDSTHLFNWHSLTSHFDKIYSFDKLDCETYNYRYLPNFYIDTQHTLFYPDIDVFFVGTSNFDRKKVLDKIISQLKTDASLVYFIKLLEKKKLCPTKVKVLADQFIIHNIIPIDELDEYFIRSRVILDIECPFQSGYSHRLIYALSQNKKIITTNAHIKNEIFFDAAQIQIIDRKNPAVDIKWIKTNYTNISSSNFVKKYSLDNWINEILSGIQIDR